MSQLLEQRFSEAFNPRRTDPCFCGSGKRFKACCGSMSADRPPPHGLILAQGWLPPDECAAIVSYAAGQPRGWLGVARADQPHAEPARIEGRVTEAVVMGDWQARLDEHVRRAMREVVEPQMDCEIEWFSHPQLLYYKPGGQYGQHADSEDPVPGTTRFQVVNDRHVSVLLYLNDEFEGGEVSFTNFNFSYHPRRGDLLLFPSDNRYLHRAEPVRSGERYAVVSWATRRGEPRVLSAPPPDALFMDPA